MLFRSGALKVTLMAYLMVIIVTLMLIGFATPSEAAAFGALGVIILASSYYQLLFHHMKILCCLSHKSSYLVGLIYS